MNDYWSFLFALLRSLTALRNDCCPFGNGTYRLWGEVRDLIWRGVDSEFLSVAQAKKLFGLASNALAYSARPFPDPCNSGPCMPDSVWYERHIAVGKPQAVPANEPVQLQPVAARRELRLLCLLVPSRDGQARSLPVHTLRPMPPRVCPTRAHIQDAPRRWCLDALAVPVGNHPGLYLRETHAQRPTSQVLERCGKHRQARAIRAAARTFRADGVSV